MIHLHDRTRRRIALAIFFALGLAPTLAVSAWGVWWRSGRHVEREAEQLGWRLGMSVSLSGVRHPARGVVVYEELRIREPETHQPVFRCREVEARWNEIPGGSNGRKLRLALSQPEIVASQWGEVWRVIDRLLTGRAEANGLSLRLAAEELSIVGPQSTQKLVQADVRVNTRPTGPDIEAAFRLAGKTECEPARLLITRNRQVTPAATGMELDTGGGPLPCGLLAIALPGFDLVGPGSWFRGALRLELSPGGPNGELAGQFSKVDLEQLVSDHSQHRVSGIADLSVEIARFRRGRLEEATGSLEGGPGMVGRSLLEVAIQRLGMAGGIGIDRADRLLPYEHLAVWFACDAKGLRLQGLAPTGAAGTMLAGRMGAILSEPQPSDSPLPLATVLQALAPEAEHLIPIARQNDWLLRRLPSVPPATQPDAENPLR